MSLDKIRIKYLHLAIQDIMEKHLESHNEVHAK